MTHRRPRARIVALAAITTTMMLTGCVSDIDMLVEPKTTGATVMTPDEAKHDLWDRLDAAQEILGGTWDEHDSPAANQCDDGFYYFSVRRSIEPVTDIDTPTEAIKAYWTANGDTVSFRSFAKNHRQVTDEPHNGTIISYNIGEIDEGLIVMVAEGPCIPGDFGQVRKDDIRKLDEHDSSEAPQH